ncbi:MAG TPA: right-handed parallel beta-helix repeat-containing protein [Fimbriimonadaceae bacterium]|nr:right-handed parallel beta-helix repeat-containing protein [Fimbriimonadaceae bacterium]
MSPEGNDLNSGSATSPKQTPFGALGAARSIRSASPGTQVILQFQPGTYYMTSSLQLVGSDSGTSGAPLIFRGTSKDVFFDGSRPVSGWQKVSGSDYNRLSPGARDNVFVAPLTQMFGTGNFAVSTPIETGVMSRRGFQYTTVDAWSTLIFNGKAMNLARYPNTGWMTVPSYHDGSASSIEVTDPTPYGWQNNGDIWAHGYYAWDWADSYEHVTNFDPSTGKMNFEQPSKYGISANHRFVIVNALEAVDAPGEFYVDRSRGLVFFFPPMLGATDAQKIDSLNAGTSLTTTGTALVDLLNVSDVTFENITFQGGRDSAADVRYAARVSFNGCTFRNFGQDALRIYGGTDHSVISSDFYDLDEGGILLYGGDRTGLAPSGHLIDNCYFHNYSRVVGAFRPAVDIWGVGNTVKNCRIEDAPQSAIVLHGNNNLIEYNDIQRVCLETNDSGAIYVGRNPTFQGNQVINNKFTDINSSLSGNYSNFTVGVYVDDMANGMTIAMNVFKNVQVAVVIGGGRDNTIDNNYFFDCPVSVHFDARGKSWMSGFLTAWNVSGMLAEVPYQGSVWANAYPNFPKYLNDDPASPKRDTLTHSVCVGNTNWLLLLDGLKTSSNLKTNPPIYADYNSVTLTDPGFTDMANEDYTFNKRSSLRRLKIKTIYTDNVGLYTDGYRYTLP